MSRARFQYQDDWQPAAASENGSGWLSFYMLPPLAALLIIGLVALVALKSPLTPSALPMNNSTLVLQSAAQNFASNQISPIFTKEVQHWGNDIVRWANAAGVDPNLAATVMQIESCGDPRATSRSGATSLFQVMPFHFRLGENPYDPETNAVRGMNYLARSLQAGGGNARLALAGYNGGIGVISRNEWLWPSETKRYVLYGAPIYEDARNGATSSASLTEWYQKYGAGLCGQAAQRLGIR
ncbi:MAG TPA: lytic transglycosylase domain-containing protein [Candidatus Saccharimonadales bacterium]|nr:lytic transglycosylase domain-containing protein [Candidatus Saccharimonadales bacterium]